MDRRDLLKTNRQAILNLARTYGVHNLRVFGSVARGDAGADTDIDILVDVERGRSFLDLVAFWQDLQDLLGCEVDVITDGSVSPYLRESIYSEAVPL